MKNKMKLLALSTTTLLAAIALVPNTNTNNEYEINTKIANQEGFRVARAAQVDSEESFVNGTGSEYVSNVKVQHAEGDSADTESLRFVAAIKGDVTSHDEITLPGTYGFHISYAKAGEVKNYMCDVDYVYHSIGENIDGTTTYYTNDFSTHVSDATRRTIQDFTGNAADEYNLFIALELRNIPSINADDIITVQPYLRLESGAVYSSTNYRYATVNNASHLATGYYLEVGNKLTSMSSADGEHYQLNVDLAKGTEAKLLNYYGEVVDTYTSVLDAKYIARFSSEGLEVVTKLTDTVLEAEDGVYSGSYNVFSTSAASGGMGACNFDNCGQGMSLRYYAYEAGTYDVVVGYWTGAANSKSHVYVNGTYQTTAVYSEAVGWAPEGVKASETTISLTFVQGWNTIALSKAGKASDNPQYGGWAMFDYVKVLENSREIDPTNFDLTANFSFRVEAEHGAFQTGELPKNDARNESGEYYVGNFDDPAAGDNITFTFKAPLTGNYDLQIGYAKAGNAPKVDVSLNNSFVETVSFDNYANESWDNFNLNSHKTRLSLSSENTNTLKVAINTSWMCFDYIVLTYVG